MRKNSDSRIFVLTGVYRKDIKCIRQKFEQENSQITSSASPGGDLQLVGTDDGISFQTVF